MITTGANGGVIYPVNTTTDFLFGSSASSSARFRLTANNMGAGTLGVASISGNTSFATLVVDNQGVGDLFTANQVRQGLPSAIPALLLPQPIPPPADYYIPTPADYSLK
jgi:hypothetical protein